MPAELLPDEEAIKKVAQLSDWKDLLRALQAVQREGSILNRPGLDRDLYNVLQRLAELGLVDPGYNGPVDGRPFIWVLNSNGERVLRYHTGIRAGPHYEISSSELAAWLERQGEDRWWNVDGDPLLGGSLAFPCPADELAEELRRINRPLLVQAKKGDADARGQVIDAAMLDSLVGLLGKSVPASGARSEWAANRLLYLCWKHSTHEWLLIEDRVTTEQSRVDEEANSR